MWPKFQLIHLFELTAIVGVTLAVDQLPLLWPNSSRAAVPLLIIACGTLTGVYLGCRWSWSRDLWSIMAMCGAIAAIATVLNAGRIGIVNAQDIPRIRNLNFLGWNNDVLRLRDWMLTLAIISSLLACGCAAVLSLVCRMWRLRTRVVPR